MGKVYLTKSGGGGGGELNFQVIGSTVEPASPEENTIWVNTNTAINGYVFAAESPEAADDGMLWITTGPVSAVEFNAIKKNALQVRPVFARQYISGAWVNKVAKIYQGGEWVELVLHLFKNGVVNTNLVGSINGTNDGTQLVFSYTSMATSANKTYTTTQKVNLDDVNEIHYRMMCKSTLAGVYFRGFASNTAYDGINVTSGGLAAYVNSESPFNSEEREVVLDVSGLMGDYYIGYAWGVASSASGSRTINGYIYEWWLE